VSAGLAYSLYRLHVRPSLCRTSASEVAVCDLRRYTSVICLLPLQELCLAVAILLHYCFLAAFFLMLVMGIQLCIYVFAVFHVHRVRDTAAMIFAAWCKCLTVVRGLGSVR